MLNEPRGFWKVHSDEEALYAIQDIISCGDAVHRGVVTVGGVRVGREMMLRCRRGRLRGSADWRWQRAAGE